MTRPRASRRAEMIIRNKAARKMRRIRDIAARGPVKPWEWIRSVPREA